MSWLYRRRGSQNWWIGYRANGRLFGRSTGTADKAEAERKLARIRSMFQAYKAGDLDQVYQALTRKQLSAVTLDKALADWILEVNSTTSPRTAEKYFYSAELLRRHFRADAQTPLLRDLTSEHLRSFLAARLSKTSIVTANAERKILSTFFTRNVRNGLIHENPMAPVRPYKLTRIQRSHRRPFTVQELRALFETAPKGFWKFMVLAGFCTALRLGDLITVVCGAFDFERRLLRVTTRKTQTGITIPLHPQFRAFMEELKSKRRSWKPSAPLWPKESALYLSKGSGSFSNEFYDRVLVPAGLVPARAGKQKKKGGRGVRRELLPLSFHCLRHTFITLLRVSGGNQAVAKELAGHSSDLVNDDYTHMPVDVLAKAVNRLPGVTQ